MWGKRAVSFRYMLAASCFVLILFSVLSVSVLAGREMAATVEENTLGSVRNVFEQSNQELRRQLEEIEAAYSAAAIDVTLIDAVRLENAQDSVYDKYLNFHQIEKILKNACKNHPMLDNVALYTPHGNLLLANSGTSAPYREELPAQPWFGELRSGALQRYVAGNFELTLSPAPYEQTKTVYLLAQRFYDYRDMRYLGVLLFAADTRAFYDTIDALPLTEGMGLAILDRDRRVLHARGLSPAFCEGLARQEAPADGGYRAVGDGKYFIVAPMLIPGITNLIPLYSVYTRLGLDDTYIGLILLYIPGTLSFATIVMKNYFDGLHYAIEEAALIDGCSRVSVVWRVVLPVVAPGLLAIFIVNFVTIWNDFMITLIFTRSNEMRTLTLTIYNMIGTATVKQGPLSATAFMTLLPALGIFLLCRKRFIGTMLDGAVKG